MKTARMNGTMNRIIKTAMKAVAASFMVCILALSAHAQVNVAPLELVRQQFLSSTGVPLAGGCLTFNATGTSTPQAIYVDSGGVIQAPNPYQLDAAGESNIWLSNTGYDLTVYAGVNNTLCSVSLGAQQWQQKNINPFAIINGGSNYIVASGTSDPSGVAGMLAYRSDIPCFRGFTTLWDCFVEQNLTQTLANKTLTSPTINGGTINNAALNNATINGTFSIIIANTGVTGTTLNTLTKLTGAPSTAVIVAITDTGGVVGVTIANAGTVGNATVQTQGIAPCVFDGATVAGDFVIISTTTAGNCHDLGGGGYPSSGQAIGRVLSTNGASGTYSVDLFSADIRAPNATTVYPSVVYNTASAATNANIVPTTMVTVGASNATYRFTFYADQTAVGTSCVSNSMFQLTITYQDPNEAAPFGFAQSGSTSINTNNGTVGHIFASFLADTTMILRAKSGTPIQYSVVYTLGSGCSPGPQYQIFPILEQLTAN